MTGVLVKRENLDRHIQSEGVKVYNEKTGACVTGMIHLTSTRCQMLLANTKSQKQGTIIPQSYHQRKQSPCHTLISTSSLQNCERLNNTSLQSHFSRLQNQSDKLLGSHSTAILLKRLVSFGLKFKNVREVFNQFKLTPVIQFK